MKSRPFGERTLDRAEKDARAAQLRAHGRTYQQIADELHISVTNAHHSVQRALRETVREPSQELISLEQSRLDWLWAAAVRAVEHGASASERLQGIDRALKVMERRARLLGLDAPVNVNARVTDALDAQIEALAAEVFQLLDPETT